MSKVNKVNKVNQELSQFQLQVKELLENAGNNVINKFFNSEMTTDCGKYDSDELCVISGQIDFHHQSDHGGEEQGEDYWSVYKFTNGKDTCYVKFDGWYQSYNGSEFNEWFFVSPVEKMVTFYE
jgi:hypothetical protein